MARQLSVVSSVAAFLLAATIASATPLRARAGDNPQMTTGLQNGTVTISGISAGAAMVIQYQFAWSSQIRGAGVVAGLPFYCAQGNGVSGAFLCMDSPYSINLQTLMNDADYGVKQGLLDPLSNIRDQQIMLWSGTADTVVAHGSMLLVSQMYSQYLKVNQSNQVNLFNYSAEHSWITNFYGNGCGYLGSPYLNNCGYDFAGEFLTRSWDLMQSQAKNGGNLPAPSAPWNSTRGDYISANMVHFDLSQFGANALIGLDTTSYLYIPDQCKPGSSLHTKCHLHVNFHGCEQYRQGLNPHTEYVANTGLNQWAESNDIVVFYPQTVGTMLIPENPKGCFDWWGYVDSNYANKKAPQIKVIHAAIEWLLGSQ